MLFLFNTRLNCHAHYSSLLIHMVSSFVGGDGRDMTLKQLTIMFLAFVMHIV